MTAGRLEFLKLTRDFTTFREMPFVNISSNIQHKIEAFYDKSTTNLDGVKEDSLDQFHEAFKKDLEEFELYIIDQINKVPIDWKSKLYEANTPFTTHLRILECMSCARTRIDVIDPYLKPDFFYLYLADLDKSIKIRLVTTKGKNDIKDSRNRYGIKCIECTSKLFSKEFTNYQLIEHNSIHDRNLRVDDNIFYLGPGIDRAGVHFTNFGVMDNPEECHKLDNIIAEGTPYTHK